MLRKQLAVVKDKIEQARMRRVLKTLRLACKNEKLTEMAKGREELETKVGERVIANKNASNLFQDRII